MPEKGLTSLNQHLDLAWLREAYRRTRKDGAVGVDGQTAADYEKDLEGNLRSLLERAKSGTYWAPPVRRVHIPKGTGGETRPIGIPTLEDKVLQRAVVMLLEPIYEEDFYDSSSPPFAKESPLALPATAVVTRRGGLAGARRSDSRGVLHRGRRDPRSLGRQDVGHESAAVLVASGDPFDARAGRPLRTDIGR
jgi:hypothetical protein